jgi:hypothetical protein
MAMTTPGTFKQSVLERVEAPLVARGIPPAGVLSGDLVGEEPAEDGVASVRGRSGKDRVVVGFLDLEILGDKRSHGPPLIEAHAVEHDEVHGVFIHQRDEKLPDQVHGEERAALPSPHPTRILPHDPDPEFAPQVGHEGSNRVQEALLSRLLQPEVPVGELRKDRGEIVGGRRVLKPRGQAGETSGEVLGHPLLADARALENPCDHGEDLSRTRGLDQVVVYPATDGLGHRVVLFGLRDHHHPSVRVLPPEDLQNLQPPATRHLLIQEHQVVCIVPEQRESVVAVGDGIDVITPRLQEEQVRTEEVDLVVDPENPLGGTAGQRHEANL